MATKDLYVYVNDVGQKIKTSGLTFNQNSTNSLIHFITVGYFKAITAAFRTADGELSANYNVPYTGKYTITSDDTEPALVENADDLYEYELYIPYKVSSTFIVASSSRISVAFHCFNYDNNTKVLVNTMTANTQLLMNRADVSDSIDESYNLTDVENLWKTVNDLNYYNDTQDTLISANSTAISSEATRAKAAEAALDTAKADKATTLAGYGITDAYTKAETTNELAKYLPLAGGTLTGLLYTSSSTPFFIGLDGKVGMIASDSTNKNYGQMNISNAWYDSTHWGAQMSAYNGATDKYNSIRISHNGPQYIDENDVAHLLGNADDITAETTRATTAETTLTNTKQNISDKGIANGYASLDDTGKVPSTQLPSYVDDVIEYESKTDFSTTGENGKIYVAKDTNLTYRWSGSAYVEISESLALGETSSTAYAGDKGKATTDKLTAHVADTNNPHNVTKTQVGLSNVDNTSDADKPISTATQTAINNEATTRMNADTALQTNLTAESNTRLANDGALDKRVTNLENAAEGKIYTTTTDSTAAYMKSIPDSSCSYGLVSKIYGRDRVCTNFAQITLNNSITLNGVTIEVDSNGNYILNGTSTSTIDIYLTHRVNNESYLYVQNKIAIPHTYTLSNNIGLQNFFGNISAYFENTATSTTALPLMNAFVRISANMTYSNAVLQIMLNTGSTALPYEPYFSGFYNNTVSKVRVSGANLCTNTVSTRNGVLYYMGNFYLKPSTAYTVTIFTNNTNSMDCGYYLTKASDNSVIQPLIASGGSFKNNIVYSFTTDSTISESTLTNFRLNSGSMDNYNGTYAYIMLNEGSTALTYAAYTESDIDISSLGKTLHGIDLSNSTKCDELDLVNKTYTKRVGSRAYQEGDDEDASVITDGTNTYYILDTPIVSTIPITDDFKFFPSTSLGSLTFENDKKDDVLSEVATEVKVA